MASNLDAERAAAQLDQKLRMKPWYVSVGVGDTDGGVALFLYVKSKRHRDILELGNSWLGYKLIVEPVGSIRPATASHEASPRYFPAYN
jgi:hypothetical protein